jgi:hypothetical protein
VGGPTSLFLNSDHVHTAKFEHCAPDDDYKCRLLGFVGEWLVCQDTRQQEFRGQRAAGLCLTFVAGEHWSDGVGVEERRPADRNVTAVAQAAVTQSDTGNQKILGPIVITVN